jgi:hypothetical protein
LLDSENYKKLIQDAPDEVGKIADESQPMDSPVLDLFITATDLDGIGYEFDDALGNRIKTKQYNTVFQFKVRPRTYPFAKSAPEKVASGLDEAR